MAQPKNKAAVPKLWPAEIEYLRAPRYSSTLVPSTRDALRQPTAALAMNQLPLQNQQSPSPLVQIERIENIQHPAHGQYGLFASRHLAPGTPILSYVGVVHDVHGTDPMSDYDLSLDREKGVAVDAARAGNEARFINDYRGIQDRPNAEFRDCWVSVGNGLAERRIVVFVLDAGKRNTRSKGIAKGTEILVSYGKGFWAERSQADAEQLAGDNAEQS